MSHDFEKLLNEVGSKSLQVIRNRVKLLNFIIEEILSLDEGDRQRFSELISKLSIFLCNYYKDDIILLNRAIPNNNLKTNFMKKLGLELYDENKVIRDNSCICFSFFLMTEHIFSIRDIMEEIIKNLEGKDNIRIISSLKLLKELADRNFWISNGSDNLEYMSVSVFNLIVNLIKPEVNNNINKKELYDHIFSFILAFFKSSQDIIKNDVMKQYLDSLFSVFNYMKDIVDLGTVVQLSYFINCLFPIIKNRLKESHINDIFTIVKHFTQMLRGNSEYYITYLQSVLFLLENSTSENMLVEYKNLYLYLFQGNLVDVYTLSLKITYNAYRFNDPNILDIGCISEVVPHCIWSVFLPINKSIMDIFLDIVSKVSTNKPDSFMSFLGYVQDKHLLKYVQKYPSILVRFCSEVSSFISGFINSDNFKDLDDQFPSFDEFIQFLIFDGIWNSKDHSLSEKLFNERYSKIIEFYENSYSRNKTLSIYIYNSLFSYVCKHLSKINEERKKDILRRHERIFGLALHEENYKDYLTLLLTNFLLLSNYENCVYFNTEFVTFFNRIGVSSKTENSHFTQLDFVPVLNIFHRYIELNEAVTDFLGTYKYLLGIIHIFRKVYKETNNIQKTDFFEISTKKKIIACISCEINIYGKCTPEPDCKKEFFKFIKEVSNFFDDYFIKYFVNSDFNLYVESVKNIFHKPSYRSYLPVELNRNAKKLFK